MPVKILFGSHTRQTSIRVCELLHERLDGAHLECVDGVEHMAPMTHAHIVNPLIANHLEAAA